MTLMASPSFKRKSKRTFPWPSAKGYYNKPDATAETIDAEGAVYAPPAIARPVNDDEDISREEGGRDRLNPPRVAAVLPVARHEGAEALIVELPRGVKLALRKRTGDVPTLTLRKLT